MLRELVPPRAPAPAALALSDEIQLDARAGELGIMPGTVYRLEFFHAERHTTESNFRVDTNLAFVNCGEVIDIR